MPKHHVTRVKLACILFAVLLLCACAAPAAPQSAPEADVPLERVRPDINLEESPFRHLNNGGVTEHDTLPYNIDAITGATQTVEGPGVKTSIPLSIREIENQVAGNIVRGVYKDSRGAFLYEGMDVYHMITGMKEGDNGIILTNTAYEIVFKNHARETLAVLTIEDIKKAHEAGRPVVIAYGVGLPDGSLAAPFVFDAANNEGHSLGYIEELHNEDGCLKLVYDLDQYGNGNSYDTFSNVAYVYIREKDEPGFKHTANTDSVYASSQYADYLVTFRGSALGHELVLPVRNLEALVSYHEDGSIVGNGIGYTDYYSLANNAYWYVNQYEGLDLYKLLQYLGMPDADTMGLAESRTAMVQFIAADGVPSTETFSIDTLSYPDVFGFYTKNSADPGDGTYIPAPEDLERSGYPILLSYGVNNYPYTISKTDDGYLSGLSNSGGPLRVVFGKTQYNHANGSRQVQYLSDVIVGDDVLYQTHAGSSDSALRALSKNTLQVTVNSTAGQVLTDRQFTVSELEGLIYGADVAANVKAEAKVKDTFQKSEAGGYSSAVYEGVNLKYLLMDALGLQGMLGTITFTGENSEVTVDLSAAFEAGYNTELQREGLLPIIAFAKNGSPLTTANDAPGYIKSLPLKPYLSTEPDAYAVDNAGGPLMLLLPSSDPVNCNAQCVERLTGITVNLEPDAYAHINPPYSGLSKYAVRVYGEGLAAEKEFTVEELESRQTKAETLDYSILNKKGTHEEARYRGLAVYDLFTEIGLNSNAGDVIFYASDGSTVTLPLSLVKGRKYENYLAKDKPLLYTMLAYGIGNVETDRKDGLPLAADDDQKGYVEAYDNDGGPIKLVVPQKTADDRNAGSCLDNIVAIEVTANDVDTWSHSMSDVFGEFQDSEFTLTIKNDANEWTHNFTVAQLEKLKQVIVRDTYTVLDIGVCEGLDLWKFAKLIAGSQADLSNPVSVTVYASDGYKNDLLSVFYQEGLEQGVLDGDGNRKPILICYAINGYPLVDSEEHEGYTGLAGNTAGPLRCVAETVQGASVKYLSKLVITLPGTDALNITIDESLFAE